MAELSKNIRRVGGELVSHKRPYGRRLLLPAEVELCNALGLSEDEYWYFEDKRITCNGSRPKGYELIPDIRNELVTTVAGVTKLTALGQVAVSVALAAVGYLLTPKPKAIKAGGSQRTEDAIGNKRFAPQFSFNSLQELAVLGSTVPLVFANRRTENGITYGGVRVNSQLLWSQLVSLGKLQQLKAMALFSLGSIDRTADPKTGKKNPEYEGYAIGDMLLNSYNSSKVALYFSDGSQTNNRLDINDKYSESELQESILSSDPFSIEAPDETGDPTTSKVTSSTRNPSTQTVFGLYAPMPNCNYYRLPYQLIRAPRGSSNPAARDTLRKRKKVEIAKWPIRAGITTASNAGNLNSEILYQILGSKKDADDEAVGRQKVYLKTDESFGYHPHGVQDIDTATSSIRETADTNIAKGESYMIGTAIAKCSEITTSNPWTLDASKHYTFKITEKGSLDNFNNLGLHTNNPLWEENNAKAWDVNGRKIYYQQRGVAPNTEDRQLKDGHEVYLIQRLALGTVTNSRSCWITEIGLKSKVFKRISAANVNSQPDEEALDRAWTDRTQIQLGQMDLFAARMSFFKLQVREAGLSTNANWIDLINTLQNHTGLFAIRGTTDQFQYNSISIAHPNRKQYEYRFKPYPGNYITRNNAKIGQRVNLLSASNNEEHQDIETFSSNGFVVRFAGKEDYVLSIEALSNSEWKLGDPNETFYTGRVETLETSDGLTQWMSNGGAFQIPRSQQWVLDSSYTDHYTSNPDTVIKYVEWEDNDGKYAGHGWGFWWGGESRDSGYWGGPNSGTSRGSGIWPTIIFYNDWIDDGITSRFKASLNAGGGHPNNDPNAFYIDKYDLKLVDETSQKYSVNVQYASGSSGGGSGLKVNLEVWKKTIVGGDDLIAAKWTIDPDNMGVGYHPDDQLKIPATGDFPGIDNLNIYVEKDKENILEENLNPYDVVADWTPYEGDSPSHQNNPEHEICFVNEITTLSEAVQYSDLAYSGIRLNSSKEWTNFTQFSAYFKKGIKVKDLVSGGSDAATNLFPEIAYALLTDSNLGAGDLVGADSVELKDMKIAANYCKKNRYFWDGTITERVNLRDFLYRHAGYCLLDFTIIGGKFSLVPTLPFNTDFSINHGVNIARDKKPLFNEQLSYSGTENYIKALFTDGNINDLKVSFLSPEERQMLKANVLYRKEKENGFPETLSILVSLLKEYDFTYEIFKSRNPYDDAIETFDLSGFCTSEDQAVDFAKYVLKTRKEVDHGLTFKTAPQYVLGLIPGDYFRLVSEATHTSRFRNGAITPDGKVISMNAVTGSHSVYVWKPGTENVESTTINFSSSTSIQSHAGKLFTVKNTTTENRIYKVESLSYAEDGLIEVAGSHAPVNSLDQLIILQGWGSDTHFKIERA
jgi:hypothetical protein